MNFLKIESFSKISQKLRSQFEKSFANPRVALPSRFKWDPWYVKNQYYLLRTPAWEYFDSSDYNKIHSELVNWGRKNLGCWDISPPWLSLYLDGHHQKPHADRPHGPFAFVLSLCTGKSFEGGETFILKSLEAPEKESHFYESEHFFDFIKPKFNQLLVFHPGSMHGVETVRGPRDPLEGRLVLHGWFTKPCVQIEGPLSNSSKQVQNILDTIVKSTLEHLKDSSQLKGYFCVEINVSPKGEIARSQIIASTNKITEQLLDKALKVAFKNLPQKLFQKKSKGSKIRLPIEFS